ncbi:MAG TPA: hypothetical protein VK789_26865 [Bryobacteraceae bacterium]|nr:hypothetical protein [Bryobacteraceae bacterium]
MTAVQDQSGPWKNWPFALLSHYQDVASGDTMPGSRTVFGTTDTAWRVGLLRQPGADAVIPNPGYEADPMSTETPGKKLPRAASKRAAFSRCR